MAHGDAVIDCDRVEFLGDAARRFDLARDELAEILEMHMSRHELRERVHHRDDRLAEIAVLHAGGAPKATGAGHVAAMSGCAGAIGWHRAIPVLPGESGGQKGSHGSSTTLKPNRAKFATGLT